MAAAKKERTTLRLNARLYRQIKSHASARGSTITAVIEQALQEFLRRRGKRR